MDLEIGAHDRADLLPCFSDQDPGGNDEKHMMEQTVPLVDRKKKGGGGSRERQSFTPPFQEHTIA